MKPTTKAALFFAGFVVLIGAGGVAYEQYQEAYPPEHDKVPDSPDGRLQMAAELGSGYSTEGADDQGLVIDLADCDYASLQAVVHERKIARGLAEHGFTWVRCTNGVRVDAPW